MASKESKSMFRTYVDTSGFNVGRFYPVNVTEYISTYKKVA